MNWRRPQDVPFEPQTVPESLEPFKLSPRLLHLALWVPRGARLVDVGCDHAMVPIALARAGRIASAIAVDRAKAPLAVAAKNRRAYDAVHQVELRLGVGLSVIGAGEVDTVLLAGLGGRAIAKVFQHESLLALGVRTLILQPNTEPSLVRSAIFQNGWTIKREALITSEQRLFLLMEVVRAKSGERVHCSAADLMLGPKLRARPSPVFVSWLKEQVMRLEAQAEPRSELEIMRQELARLQRAPTL